MELMKTKKKYEPIKIHSGHHWMLERGQWGPHRARYICRDCDCAFIQWVKVAK